MVNFVLLRFQHDIILAYTAVTLLIPILYFGYSVKFKRSSFAHFSIWYHLGTIMYLLGPLLNCIHDLATSEYTVGAEIAMACLMGILVIGETVLLYTFIKTTWSFVTFTPYVNFFSTIKQSFMKNEIRYEPVNGDEVIYERIPRNVPESLKPFSWRKWFTIDLMLNWYCSQLLLTFYYVIMYSLRASSISIRKTGVYNNRKEELAVFSGLTGIFTAIFIWLDIWVYRLYTSSNLMFYLTAMIYYFGCLTEYFVTVSRQRMDYVTVSILCALIAIFMVKIGVAQTIKSRYDVMIELKED